MTAAPRRAPNNPPRPLRADAAADLADLHELAAEVGAPCVVGDVLDPITWISDDPADQRHAARVCLTCPLIEECTGYARGHHVTGGVWGMYKPHRTWRTP